MIEMTEIDGQETFRLVADIEDAILGAFEIPLDVLEASHEGSISYGRWADRQPGAASGLAADSTERGGSSADSGGDPGVGR